MEDGYYWVKVPPHGIWVVFCVSAGYFYRNGAGYSLRQLLDSNCEINKQRIKTPDEK